MTVQKRTRILEIITALLMIRPALLLSQIFSYHDAEIIRSILKLAFPMLLASVALAIVIITRKYYRTWAKLLVITSLAANFCTYNNFRYLKNIGSCIRAYSYSPSLLLEYLFGTFLFLLGIAAGVILVLAMFGKIKWKSRKSLIIYAYIMTGIMALGALAFRIHNIYYAELVMMTCLIYELQEKSDSKAVIGWAGALAAAVSDIFFDFYTDKVQSIPADGGFFDYLNYVNPTIKYEGIRSLIFAAAILLIPLILFERKEPLEKVTAPVNYDDDDND
ncbi:hypothetical protein [Ruminococcus flavefaciens]|uniref:hypothetical protein n=1 Tax=Ruminococcus flavefaciens TaxID=1265 RepID=UPI0026F2D82F|nr:hypothetical protein [Ruminococcus flavefaciens]